MAIVLSLATTLLMSANEISHEEHGLIACDSHTLFMLHARLGCRNKYLNTQNRSAACAIKGRVVILEFPEIV